MKFTQIQLYLLFSVEKFSLLQVKTNTVVHDFNGHEVNGKHGFNGKKCYDGGFYVVNNGKIDV